MPVALAVALALAAADPAPPKAEAAAAIDAAAAQPEVTPIEATPRPGASPAIEAAAKAPAPALEAASPQREATPALEAAAPPTSDGARPVPAFRCDGTDPFFFEELNQAGTLGYGETWDETICDEGLAIYSEATKHQWSPFKRKRVKVSANDQLLAFAVPAFVFGGLASVFAIAGVLALISRLKKRVVLDVPCPSCSSMLPISEEDSRTLFCPMCGAACAVDIRGKGRNASAVARPLSG